MNVNDSTNKLLHDKLPIDKDTNHPVPYSDFLTFLGKLENNRRTAQISSVVIQPNTRYPSVIAFTIVINEYIKP